VWSTLTWRDLETPEIAGEVAGFREGMLRLILAIAALAYLTWHFTITSIVPPDGDLPFWRFFPVPIAALGGTYLLVQVRSRVAVGFFVVSSAVAITIAIWLLRAPNGSKGDRSRQTVELPHILTRRQSRALAAGTHLWVRSRRPRHPSSHVLALTEPYGPLSLPSDTRPGSPSTAAGRRASAGTPLRLTIVPRRSPRAPSRRPRGCRASGRSLSTRGADPSRRDRAA